MFFSKNFLIIEGVGPVPIVPSVHRARSIGSFLFFEVVDVKFGSKTVAYAEPCIVAKLSAECKTLDDFYAQIRIHQQSIFVAVSGLTFEVGDGIVFLIVVRTLVPRIFIVDVLPVGAENRRGGIHSHCRAHQVGSVVPAFKFRGEFDAEFKTVFLVKSVFGVDASGELVPPAVIVVGVRTVISKRAAVYQLVAAALEREVVILGHSVLVNGFAPPVGAFGVGDVVDAVVCSHLIVVGVAGLEHFFVFGSLSHTGVAYHAQTERRGELELGLALLAFFGGDKHNAVGCPCTVDGGCRSIFKHLHTLDVFGIEEVDIVAYGHTVHDVERIGAIDGGYTSDDYPRRCARCASGRNLYAVHLALQCVHSVARIERGNVVALDGGDTGSQVGFLGSTVADYHYFVESLGVFHEDEVDGLVAIDNLRLAHKAQHRTFYRGAFGDGDSEIAVDVGNSAVGSAFFHNDGTEQSLAVLVCYRTLHRNILGKGADRKQHHCD